MHQPDSPPAAADPRRGPSWPRRALPYALATLGSVSGGLVLAAIAVASRIKVIPPDALQPGHRNMMFVAVVVMLVGTPATILAFLGARATALPARPGPQWRVAAARYRQLQQEFPELLAVARAAGVDRTTAAPALPPAAPSRAPVVARNQPGYPPRQRSATRALAAASTAEVRR